VTLPELTGPQLRQQLADGWKPWLVHLGTSDEFATAHLPGAVHLPTPAHLAALLRDGDHAVLYGTHPASNLVADWSHTVGDDGQDRLWHYPGGLVEWTAAGFPTEP